MDELTSISADKLRNLPKIKEIEKHNRIIDRIVKKTYKDVIDQALNPLIKRNWYVFHTGDEFDIDFVTKFLKDHHSEIISKLKKIFFDCKITYSEVVGARGLYVLKVDWGLA